MQLRCDHLVAIAPNCMLESLNQKMPSTMVGRLEQDRTDDEQEEEHIILSAQPE